MTDQRKQMVNLSSELQEQLVQMAPTSYSISGHPPVSSSWMYTPDAVCDIIRTHTLPLLKDLSDVTLEVNHKTGAVYAYVWLPNNSKNICDNELNSGHSAINRTMTKFSPALKEFMEKFCEKDKRRIFREEGNLPLAGIEVRIDKFMEIELDVNGFQFGKLFGDAFKKKTKIDLICDFTKGDDGRYGKLTYIRATKSLRNRLRRATPKPRRSFNAR